MELLDYLDYVNDGSHAVAVFSGRNSLRACLEQYNQQRDPRYRTRSLHRAEYLEDRKRHSRIYLRTIRQIVSTARNRKIDGSQFALIDEGVEVTPIMQANFEESGIQNIIRYEDDLL